MGVGVRWAPAPPLRRCEMSVTHTVRKDGFGETMTRKFSPLQAIRYNCRECYGMSPQWVEEIRECPSEMCPLYPFRMGKDPGRKPASAKKRESARKSMRNLLDGNREKWVKSAMK